VPTGELRERVRTILPVHGVAAIALGSGTNASEVRALIGEIGLPIALVDERETTLRARARYFAAHPPTGWRRLVPLGMLLPPRPIDDFAAVLIAERYLADAPGAVKPSEDS
jgi:RNase H-fold protein (predicted Holliday junction resolvase)